MIEVEKTVSPYTLFVAPNDVPVKDSPVLRCRTALLLLLDTCVARALERRAKVMGFNARNVNIALVVDLVFQERVEMITDIAITV